MLPSVARGVALKNNTASIDAFDRLIQQQEFIEKKARDLIAADFHALNIQGILSMWVAIEVAVEDTVLAVLKNDDLSARQIIASFKKGKPDIPAGPLNEDSANLVFKRMERAARDQPTVMDAYCCLLGEVSVQLRLPDEESSALIELYCIRNCVMHRGGIVDNEVIEKASKLGAVLSDKIHINQDSYHRYIAASNLFATKLLEAVLGSPHMKKKLVTPKSASG